ncbi:MAG: hypothetical protein K8R74_01200, partial [Bacteroidales bacterium]|nr:hypothetical protein [Bacteroidales bacterium]
HIDEILYFFEVTNYNIVIIEDLERFEQTEIFTKLREINLLINNSKNIKKDVVFIYAIRDDMFQDNDRTKFFDFMIPIIPVINSSNSNEKLLKIIKENEYTISNDLIDDISLFIDDMRLLYNIMNEYHLYSKNLNNNLDQDKLLSMIVYKNIFPNDFTELSNNKGFLYETISNKHEYIGKEIDKIDNEIFQIKEEIKKIEIIKINNIKELRTIYLVKIIEKINISGHAFRGFWIDGHECNIQNALDDNIFQHITENSIVEYVFHTNIGQRSRHSYNFQEIEKEVDPEFTYKEREQLIYDTDNNKIELLKKNIEKVEEKKNNVRKYKIKDLLFDKQINIEIGNNKQNELINILLRNGYIGEDFLDYISIFYEGSLSKADYQFLINIKTQKNTEFDFKLNKIEKLIEKINLFEFDKEYILNYNWLDSLLSSNKQKAKRNRIFNQLKNETDLSVKFIDDFIDYTASIESFILFLCEQWTSIWSFIENESNFSEEKKEKYFKLIIEYANVKDIKEIFSDFKSKISNNKNFLGIIKDTERLKEIIKILNVKFIEIDESSPELLFDYIYEGNYYTINPKMLEIILKHNKVFKQIEFDTKNYSAIKLSDLQNLIEYVESCIDEYIASVYLKLESNTDEPLEFLIELLNNDEVSIEDKEKIINNTETIVYDVNEIEDLKVVNLLLNESKVLAIWENIISIYIQNENKLSDELISYVNVLENAKYLSRGKIDETEPDEDIVKEFLKDLLLDDRIGDQCYKFILKSIPYIYESLSYGGLSHEKVELLIENDILSLNASNYNLLKDNFGLHIMLIERNLQGFIDDIASFEIEEDDILELLQSNQISISQKEKIIENYDYSIFTESASLLKHLGKLLIDNLNFNVNENMIKPILKNTDLTTNEKITIFNHNSEKLDNDDIMEVLDSFGKPYSRITINRKRPLIDNNKLNMEFVEILKKKHCISKYTVEKNGIRISTFYNL